MKEFLSFSLLKKVDDCEPGIRGNKCEPTSVFLEKNEDGQEIYSLGFPPRLRTRRTNYPGIEVKVNRGLIPLKDDMPEKERKILKSRWYPSKLSSTVTAAWKTVEYNPIWYNAAGDKETDVRGCTEQYKFRPSGGVIYVEGPVYPGDKW